MKLVWFSHFIPYPPKGGAHQRSFNLLRYASRSHELFLVAFNLLGQPAQRLDEWRCELRKYCAHVEFWPMPVRWKSAAWWTRMAASPLYRIPYGCRSFWSPALEARWAEMLRRHQGALLHFDSIDLALFAQAAASFRKVLNHHNCESAMAERRALQQHNPLKRAYLHLEARKIARLETAACPAFNVNLAVSPRDAEALQTSIPAAHFHVVANGTDTEYFASSGREEAPSDLIFAGSLNWYPNISAVRYFVDRVWPLVKSRHAGARFIVAGMAPSQSLVRKLRQDPSILLIPDPDDIRPWIARAAVFVCPIFDGGGTKLKVLDAMAMQKPVVCTSVGCEGLDVKHGETVLMADVPEAFAGMVSLALESKSLRERLGTAGRALVERQYSWHNVGKNLDRAYRCALKDDECEERFATCDLRAT